MAEAAAAPAKGAKSKKIWKIVGIIFVLLLIVGLLYYFFGGGNKYASGSNIRMAKSGQYGTFVTWPADKPAVDTAFSGVDSAIVWPGAGPLPEWSKGAIYGAAWCKGMNVAYSVSNLNTFKSDIAAYVKNTGLRKAHWDVTSGEFLA